MKQLAWLAPLLLASACSPSLDVLPDGTAVSCGSNAECPDDLVCVADQQRCFDRQSPCIEAAGDSFRSVEAGRRCTAPGQAEGVCLRAVCAPSRCGDGIADRARAVPEECDDGAANSDLLPDACRTDCTLARCGDGVRDRAEECDDGNQSEQDDCLSTCVANRCGDGHHDPGSEECDDGNTLYTDACAADCKLAVCGDGFVQAVVEQCDDQNQNPNDGCDACRTTIWSARLVAGAGEGDGQAAAVSLNLPLGLAVGLQGDLLVADMGHHKVVKVAFDQDGARLTRVAGTGEGRYLGDGGPASQASLHSPSDLAVDKLGNLFIADVDNTCIRRVDALTGRIELAVGIPNSSGEPAGDSASASHASIPSADSVAIDRSGNLFLNQRSYHTIRWVDASTGNIHRYAGTGTPGNSGDGGRALDATLTEPLGLAVDAGGNLYFGSGNRVRRIDAATRTITTVAVLPDDLPAEVADPDGDGQYDLLGEVADLAVRADGWLAVALAYDHLIVEIAPGGRPVPLAGSGEEGFGGDGGPAGDALLAGPMGLAWGLDGALYVSDSYNNRVRRVDSTDPRRIGTVAGTGSPVSGTCAGNDCMRLFDVRGVAHDRHGDRILLAEAASSVVRWVDPTRGTNGVVAGMLGVPGRSADGGQAAQTLLFWPKDVTADDDGNIFIAEGGANRIRRIDAATGTISTYAGTGEQGDSTGPVPAQSLQMYDPSAVELDAQGNLFVSDRGNKRVRRIDAATRQATIVASGLTEPIGLAFDAQGRLLIADCAGHRVWRVEADGSLQTFAGTGARGFSGDGGAPALARLDSPFALELAADGAILIADSGNRRIRRVSPDGTRIETIAGTGEMSGPSGDGGPARLARLSMPVGLAVDLAGGLVISDSGLDTVNADLVRRIDAATGIITTILGPVRPDGSGPLRSAQLGAPAALAQLEVEPGRWMLLAADGVTSLRGVELEGDGRVSTLVGYLRGVEQTPTTAAYFRELAAPRGIAVDARDGSVYVSEADGNTIVKVATRTAPLTLDNLFGEFFVPGNGEGRLNGPHGLALDTAHETLFVAEALNHAVRALDLRTTPPTARLVAGLGEYGFLDAADATQALLNAPEALALANDGSLYVADTGNHRVRRIVPSAVPGAPASIETVTGLGLPAFGEGAIARLQPIDSPRGLAVDSHGNLFVAGGGTVWVVDAGDDGVATGDDAMRIIYGRLPRSGLAAETLCLTGMLFARTPERPESSLYLLDACQGYLLTLDRQPQ